MTLRSLPTAGLAALSLCLSLHAATAFAWGPGGHHTVGAIADRLLVGSMAAAQVKTLLDGLSLEDAAVWADCAKGIDPAHGFEYVTAGKYPECKVYETPLLEAEMADYVRRNDSSCDRKPGEESCHKQYHYTDIAIRHDHYDRRFVGARDDDVVSALGAAVQVLRGRPSPAPIGFKDKREALRVLAHLIGDIHQPLHVGAVYLDARGRRIDPDLKGLESSTETRGGNSITVLTATGARRGNLHAVWDATPTSLQVAHIDAAMLRQARAVALGKGDAMLWPSAWAGGSVLAARQAFVGLQFKAVGPREWSVVLPPGYDARMDALKRRQVIAAGARLAQLLKAIWAQ